MFTPIKSFSAGLSKLHFMFSGKWLHLKNSSKTFNVLFKLRSKKLLTLGKKARLMKVHFRVLRNNLRQTSSEIKDHELWYLYAQSSITCRMFGLEILKTCENWFSRWEEICLLWKCFTASCEKNFLQKMIEKVRTLCQKKIRNKINFFMSSGIVSLETYLKSYSKNSCFLDSLKHLQTFNGRFSAGWCILYSTCPQNLVDKIVFWINYIFFLRFSQETFRTLILNKNISV